MHFTKYSILLVSMILPAAQLVYAQSYGGDSANSFVEDENLSLDIIGSLAATANYSSSQGPLLGLIYRNNRLAGDSHSIKLELEAGIQTQAASLSYMNDQWDEHSYAAGLEIDYAGEKKQNHLDLSFRSLAVEPWISVPLTESVGLRTYTNLSLDQISQPLSNASDIYSQDLGDRVRWAVGGEIAYRHSLSRVAVMQEIGFTSKASAYSKTQAQIAIGSADRSDAFEFASSLSGGALVMLEGTSTIGDRYLLGPGAIRGFEYAGFGPKYTSANTAASRALGGNRFVSFQTDLIFKLPFREIIPIDPGLYFDAGSLWALDIDPSDNAAEGRYDDSFKIRSSTGLTLQHTGEFRQVQVLFGFPLSQSPDDDVSIVQLNIRTLF